MNNSASIRSQIKGIPLWLSLCCWRDELPNLATGKISAFQCPLSPRFIVRQTDVKKSLSVEKERPSQNDRICIIIPKLYIILCSEFTPPQATVALHSSIKSNTYYSTVCRVLCWRRTTQLDDFSTQLFNRPAAELYWN